MRLLTGGEDVGRRLREEVAVDGRRESRQTGASRRPPSICVGRHRAQRRERSSPPTVCGELDARLASASASGTGGSVGAISAPLSPIAPAIRPFDSGDAICALTEIDPADSPAIVTFFGIAAERRDVLLHPAQRRGLVEQRRSCPTRDAATPSSARDGRRSRTRPGGS